MTEPKDSAKGTRGIDEGITRNVPNPEQGIDFSVEIRFWYIDKNSTRPVPKRLTLYCSGSWTLNEVYERAQLVSRENCRVQELEFNRVRIMSVTYVGGKDESSSSGSSS